MSHYHHERRIHVLLWPFWVIWRLIALILELTGRFVGLILGLVLMLVGVITTLTLVGAIVGIPLFIIGFLLFLRSIF